MINRNAYDEIIEKMRTVYSHHSGMDFETSFSQVIDIRDNFDVKLMVVGHYNAGKSSLLNRLIGKSDFLKEAQEPQTAVATELMYDEDESAYACDTEGNKEIMDVQKEYTSKRYNHLEYRINAEALKAIKDFTIVDTPGFDAGIEAHAKALAGYIGKGSAYLVVVDQEKGGIDQTTLEFIQEISNYSSQIAVLINKCDKITADVAGEIAESARFTLESFGLPYKVYTVSKKDADISNKLISIILSFNAQAAFDKVMVKQLNAELVSAAKVLSVTQKKIFLDTFDLNSDIAMYSRLQEQLARTIDRKREEAREDLDNTVQEVIAKIRSLLIARADSIVEALLSGNQVAAEAIIVETVRPMMLATMKDISIRQIDSVTEALDFTGVANGPESMDLADVAVNLACNLKGLIEQGVFGKTDIGSDESKEKKSNVYRAITGIAAIATDFIAPWLEVVIILLPDVVNLLRGMFGESDNEVAKRRYINNVVPQIINKIYPQVKQNVQMTTEHVLNEYEKMLKEKIESIKNNMIEAQNKKKQKIEDFEFYKTQISEDLETINKLISELG